MSGSQSIEDSRTTSDDFDVSILEDLKLPVPQNVHFVQCTEPIENAHEFYRVAGTLDTGMIAVLCDDLKDRLRDSGCSAQESEAAILALYEVLGNVEKHAGKSFETSLVEGTIEGRKWLVLVVSDQGPGVKAPDEAIRPGGTSLRGQSMGAGMLVMAAVDEVIIAPRCPGPGTEVRLFVKACAA